MSEESKQQIVEPFSKGKSFLNMYNTYVCSIPKRFHKQCRENPILCFFWKKSKQVMKGKVRSHTFYQISVYVQV